uniref:Uncharacterized protein n=1 Tax=Candidatus Methanophaga sp. ANME-1 ERB7 TaxID=2759913 RepID=A0A7G9Z916_9EURY|nr:hypothetical protein HGIILDEE_00039 [Methanosarcinales archaeon ANME-1 ERB7]
MMRHNNRDALEFIPGVGEVGALFYYLLEMGDE